MIFTHAADCQFSSALTDNGHQKCQIKNLDGNFCDEDANIWPDETVELSCLGGYHANFNLHSQIVTYGYGSFWGQFYAPPTGGWDFRWRAQVWGC